MDITIRYKKTDENGNTYYEDLDGNRIVEVEPTPEEIAAKDEEYYRWVDELKRQHQETERKAKPFLLKSLGNLQKPKPRKLLWKNYWAERELCILAGDNGVGKSLMALQIASQLVKPIVNGECTIENERTPGLQPPLLKKEGCFLQEGDNPSTTHPAHAQHGHPSEEGISCLNRVLYIDWELTEDDFVQRWGEENVPENFFWAGFNTGSEMPQHVPDKIEWLLRNFTTTVKETEANILIIDQPDRLHLSPQKWNEFLTKLKALMREFNLSVMLVLSNKSRHVGRPCGLNNIPKGTILIPCADSVVMMCQNQRRTSERYFKVLKNRNRAVAENSEFVDIIELEEHEGYFQIHPWGRQSERDMLPPNAAERKNQKIMEAEKLWNSGLSCLEVAEQMYMAESTVKSWLRPLWSSSFGSPPAKEGNESRDQKSAGERGGGFGLQQPEHVATPSLTLPIAIGT